MAGGISETYLRWRGIEATLELAKSNNAKVVVIGSGKDGLPLILNTEDSLSGLKDVLGPQAQQEQQVAPQGQGNMNDTSIEHQQSQYVPAQAGQNLP